MYVLWPLALCTVTFRFPNSKKNSFRGNCMRKYSNLSFLTISLHQSLEVAFFRKCDAFFKSRKLMNITNHYPEFKIWISYLLFCAGNSKFKFRIMIWNICFGYLTNTLHFLKRSYLWSYNILKPWLQIQTIEGAL